jgi:uncharacterized membrane protein YeaQ/YmgE (transglycosylase-associated protein family)
MAVILFFTILGFLVGLVYVLIKRKINPGKIVAAASLGVVTAVIWNALQGYLKNKRYKRR